MRRHLLPALLLSLICLPAFAQDRNDPDTEFETISTVCDTDSVKVLDTLPTRSRYLKIILFDNHTWEYLNLETAPEDSVVRSDSNTPQTIESTNDAKINVFDENWDSTSLHAFKGLDPSTITEDVVINISESNPFCAPVTGPVRSGFRYRRSHAHKGVDIAAHMGDTVRAMFNGVVRFSNGGRVTGGYGNLVIIRHNDNIETYHAHLTKRLVASGESVKAGQPIGLVGSTGHSTGPHLHFEIRYKGQAFDPERVVNFETGMNRDSTIVIKPHYFSMYSHYGQTDEESKAASDRIVYVVRSGDNLGKIAAKYQTSVSAICKLNGIKSTKILHIGDRLIVR